MIARMLLGKRGHSLPANDARCFQLQLLLVFGPQPLQEDDSVSKTVNESWVKKPQLTHFMLL